MEDKRHQEYIRKAMKEAKAFADGWAKLCDEHWAPVVKEHIRKRKEEEAKNPPEPEHPQITRLRNGQGTGLLFPWQR